MIRVYTFSQDSQLKISETVKMLFRFRKERCFIYPVMEMDPSVTPSQDCRHFWPPCQKNQVYYQIVKSQSHYSKCQTTVSHWCTQLNLHTGWVAIHVVQPTYSYLRNTLARWWKLPKDKIIIQKKLNKKTCFQGQNSNRRRNLILGGNSLKL